MADGYCILLRRHGIPDGPRLVISHGNGFAIDVYWPFCSYFTDRFDVFVHDIRSHGWISVGKMVGHNLPTLAKDFACISREIDRVFSAKPKVGVFHSLTALTCLHSGICNEYAALVLFDPPMKLPGRTMNDLERFGTQMGAATRRRREHFDSPAAFAELLAGKAAFEGLDAGKLALFARATLRPSRSGEGYELGCPREYEARLWEYFYPFAGATDFAEIDCPIKVIGSDPTVPNSFIPSTEMPELLRLDYDFVPESTHLLQLERPKQCADHTIEFLEQSGLGRS